MKGGSDAYTSHFLKECSENFQRKYVNCFNRLSFLARVLKNCKKMHFSGQIKGHNSGRKHENWTDDLIFSSIFPLYCL